MLRLGGHLDIQELPSIRQFFGPLFHFQLPTADARGVQQWFCGRSFASTQPPQPGTRTMTMKHPRLYLTLVFILASRVDLISSAALRATQSSAPAQSPDDAESNNGSYTNNAPTQLTVKLSRSTRHRAKGSQEGATIPLVGIGVGNSPHHKIPFILASALSNTTDNFEDLRYRLVDTSHTDSSGLEVLVGRSLSRLLSSEGKGKSFPSSGTRDEYHLLIKIHHTHLGYERTMLSVQNSLSDILPGFSSNSGTSSSSNAIDFRVHA
eukprot:scaffold4130_cov112-Skeletonema_dohrnii-CCMP3373.AAC.9